MKSYKAITKALWVGLLGILVPILVGVFFSVQACWSESHSSPLGGLCVMPIVWSLMIALPLGLFSFLLAFVYYRRTLSRRDPTKNPQNTPSTLDLIAHPKVLKAWQEKQNGNS